MGGPGPERTGGTCLGITCASGPAPVGQCTSRLHPVMEPVRPACRWVEQKTPSSQWVGWRAQWPVAQCSVSSLRGLRDSISVAL